MPSDEKDTLGTLSDDLKALAGKLTLVETTAGGWGEGKMAAPQADYRVRRLGMEPPASLSALRRDVAVSVLAACGVPPSLAGESSDGTAQREAWRRFLHGAVQPLAVVAEAELSAKLESDISLGFDALFASDLAGRARAFQSMVGGGMEPAKAAALAGLMGAEG